ncbi:MAG: valine--tRNA ligase [Nitrospirota bacterium]
MKELSKFYNPKDVEKKWYDFWLERNYFHASTDSSRPPYCIVIPPPNITGSLHMGHALNTILQDTLIRWKRMSGYNTLWLPGVDHAGIATQNVVERQLSEEGTNRQSLGRDRFIERIWKWKEDSGRTIINQLKALGASCDWERERFTMDEGLSRAVKEVFVRLYREGLIYKGNYIINWCPRCRTALSDLEVEHESTKGKLYFIKYPATKGKGSITVATTRPETMLGDTAVAVHPDDNRYKKYIGKILTLPLVGREIPVIAERAVDPDFGTGAVKVTPAHDPDDFEIGLRHRLPQVTVIGNDGRMTPEAGRRYAGLDRYQCRHAVIDDLTTGGYLVKSQDYIHAVGHCYRCKTVVEPLISEQWFIRMKPLSEPAIEAVKSGKIRIIPAQWENTYFDWMKNIKDWCISRQIWWGHRIPAWYCKEMRNAECGMQNGIVVAIDIPEECPYCGSRELIQDEDVLDTWFSSSLWPFSTLGWPDETPELKTFYPTDVLVTGFDILFFWVARMIIMGLKFMGEIPFKDVYIHALIRDAEGQKMSKSKGNVIDPIQMISKYGTDAFRFTLVSLSSQGRDIRLSEERIEGYRHFVNKLWNAARFVLMNIDAVGSFEAVNSQKFSTPNSQLSTLNLPDRWILSRLQRIVGEVNRFLEEYRFNEAAGTVYQFVWHEFCDWYLEMIKGTLPQIHLISVFDSILRLLHPFMPFVSEEIWQKLPHTSSRESPWGAPSITIAEFPRQDTSQIDIDAEAKMTTTIEAISAIRNIRGEMNIPPSSYIKAFINVKDEQAINVLNSNLHYVQRLSKTKEVKIGKGIIKPKMAATTITPSMEIFVPLEGVLDFSAERRRLEKEMDKIDKEVSFLSRKLTDEDFITKAPKEVVEKDRNRYHGLQERLNRIGESLRRLDEIER